MNCSIFYDLAGRGLSQFWLICLPFSFSIFGIFLFVAGKGFSDRQTYLQWIGYLFLRIGGAGFAFSWFIIGLISVSHLYQVYFNDKDLLQARGYGQEKFIEGTLTNFSPYGTKPSNQPKESFVVNGTTFTYSPSEIRSGFNQRQDKSSPIHDGALVRVGYIGDTIIKIEICR